MSDEPPAGTGAAAALLPVARFGLDSSSLGAAAGGTMLDGGSGFVDLTGGGSFSPGLDSDSTMGMSMGFTIGGSGDDGSSSGGGEGEEDDDEYWVEPADDGTGEQGIAPEEMGGPELQRVRGCGLPERYGRAQGGILRNPVAGVVGGRPLVEGSAVAAAAAVAAGQAGSDAAIAAALAARGAKQSGVVWIDQAHPAGERGEEAKAHHRRTAKARVDAFQVRWWMGEEGRQSSPASSRMPSRCVGGWGEGSLPSSASSRTPSTGRRATSPRSSSTRGTRSRRGSRARCLAQLSPQRRLRRELPPLRLLLQAAAVLRSQ